MMDRGIIVLINQTGRKPVEIRTLTTEKEGKIMEAKEAKNYRYLPVDGRYTGAYTLHARLVKEGYTSVDYVGYDDQVIATVNVPGSYKTLGSYNTQAGRVLNEGLSWKEASAARVSKLPRDMQRSGKPKDFKLSVEEDGQLRLEGKDAIAKIGSLKGVMYVNVAWTAGSVYSAVAKRADQLAEVVAKKQQPEFVTLVNTYLPKHGIAKAGSYEVQVAADADHAKAVAAIAAAMVEANDNNWALLSEVTIERAGLQPFIEWYQTTTK